MGRDVLELAAGGLAFGAAYGLLALGFAALYHSLRMFTKTAGLFLPVLCIGILAAPRWFFELGGGVRLHWRPWLDTVLPYDKAALSTPWGLVSPDLWLTIAVALAAVAGLGIALRLFPWGTAVRAWLMSPPGAVEHGIEARRLGLSLLAAGGVLLALGFGAAGIHGTVEWNWVTLLTSKALLAAALGGGLRRYGGVVVVAVAMGLLEAWPPAAPIWSGSWMIYVLAFLFLLGRGLAARAVSWESAGTGPP